MLEAIRKRSSGIVVKVLLLFLVLSFAAWGVGDYITGGVTGQSVVSVGDVDISPQAFNNEMQREINRLRRIFADTLDEDMIRQIGMTDQVLSRMVRSALYLEAANEHGILIDDSRITAEIRDTPAFFGVTGKFDKITFSQVISSAGYSEQSFIRLVRDDMKRLTLVNSLDGGAVGSQYMANLIHAYRNETRSVEYAVIADSQFTDISAPSEAEIVAYHTNNQSQFMAPEYRSVSYITLSPSDFANVDGVSEQEILEAYEMRRFEFISQERRDVLQAIYADQAMATQALDMIAKGRDFAEIANELAGISADSLKLGWVVREDMMGEALADAVFATPAGGVSQVVKSLLGWHVFKVLNVKEESTQALDKVKNELAEDIALEKAIDILYEQANALEDELGSGATLEEAAQTLGLRLQVITDGVDRSGLGRNGLMAKELLSDDLLATAFVTLEGTESPLIEESDNTGYFIVRVDGVDGPALRPLETVRGKVVELIEQGRRSEQARLAAEEVVGQLNASSTLASALAPLGGGAVVNVVDEMKRDGSGLPAAMPRELVNVIFGMNIGEGSFVQGAGGYVVAHLRSINEVEIGVDADAVSQVRLELTQGMRADILDQLARALEQRISVSINRDAIRQAF